MVTDDQARKNRQLEVNSNPIVLPFWVLAQVRELVSRLAVWRRLG
jgi:hypothetical protein